jgi:hypothetical protein
MCPDFTVAIPCGELMDIDGAWFDLTGKISTPSLLNKIGSCSCFLISTTDRGKT